MPTTMDYQKTMRALKRLRVETGSLACFGCGYEHNCSTQGCAILRNAVGHMEAVLDNYVNTIHLAERQSEIIREYKRAHSQSDNGPLTVGEVQAMHGKSVYMGNGRACVVNAMERKIITVHGFYPFSAINQGMRFYRRPPEGDVSDAR